MRFNAVVGELIRELRLEKKMTLRDLSTSSHIALGYLSEIERGKKEASSAILDSLSKGLGTPLYQIVVEAGYRLMPANELDNKTELLYTQYHKVNH